MAELNVSINWLSERREDTIYRTIENIRSDIVGLCFSMFGSDDVDTQIKDTNNSYIFFKNHIISDTKGNISNLSVEGTIAALHNKKYHFYIPPDLIEYIKSVIYNKLILNEYEECFPNTKAAFDIGKQFFEDLMNLGYSSQAAYSLCGAFFVECAWDPNVYNKDEAKAVSGSSTFAQGFKNCGEGLFGLTGWQQKYKIITNLNLDKGTEIYGINNDGYLDKSKDAIVQRIPLKSYDFIQAGNEYNTQASNTNPKLFMCKESVWIKIFDEFVNSLPRVVGDEYGYKEYFTYNIAPKMSSDSDDIDHQLLYATYLFKAGPSVRKTFHETKKIIEKYINTHQNMYGNSTVDPNNLYKAKNGFVQQLLIAYMLAEYCCGTQVEDISLKDIFGSWGSLSSMNAEFLINTYVGTKSYVPLVIPPPNAEGITVINHTQNMFKRSRNIEYIILHYTAGRTSVKGSAERTVTVLDNRGYSSDFTVDDETIIQFADDPGKWASTAVQAWDSRGTEAGRNASNNNAVSIEICSNLKEGYDWHHPNNGGWYFTPQTLSNVKMLCKRLIATYKIPKSHVIRHYDIMGKACPGILGWNLASGSPNDDLYRAFVNSLYEEGGETAI